MDKKLIIIIVSLVAAFFFLRLGAALPAGLIAAFGMVYPVISSILKNKLDKQPVKTQSKMSKAEALDILGLREGANAEEIKEAYKKLIVKNHPDQGGSEYLAAKINSAKDVLLGD